MLTQHEENVLLSQANDLQRIAWRSRARHSAVPHCTIVALIEQSSQEICRSLLFSIKLLQVPWHLTWRPHSAC